MNLIRLKRELPSLIYLSIAQTYLNFTFPVFIRLGKPYNLIIPFFLSIFCIFIYIYLLGFSKGLVGFHHQEYFNDVPNELRNKIKLSEKIWLAIIGNLTFLYMWYYNIYNIHPIYYLIYYLHSFITVLIIGRAVKGYE